MDLAEFIRRKCDLEDPETHEALARVAELEVDLNRAREALNERDRLRERVAELEAAITKTLNAIDKQNPRPRMSPHAEAMVRTLRGLMT